MSNIQAACACGAHAVSLPGAPPRVTICFCADCRLRAGGPFGIATYYPSDTLVLPELPVRRRVAESGRWLDERHCPACGSVLYYTFEWKAGVVGIPLGLIAGHADRPPDRAVFCRDKPDWLRLPEGIEAFERGSDGPRWGG